VTARLQRLFLEMAKSAKWLSRYHGVCCLGSVAMACAQRDWTWLLVAAFNAAATALYLCSDQLARAPAPEGIMRFCPPWMRTPWGQAVARRVRFVGRRWKRNMDRALVEEAFYDFAFAQLAFLQAANRWAFSTAEEENHNRAELMAAWCKWRNEGERHLRAQERNHGGRLELPLYLQGMPRMEELHARDFPDAKVPDVH